MSRVRLWAPWACCLAAFGCLHALPAGSQTRQPSPVLGEIQVDAQVDEYVARYLATFPTAATAAGDHRYDRELENLTEVRLEDWLQFNQRTVEALETRLDSALDLDGDAGAVLRHARRELFRHRTLRVSHTDPLFWTGIVGGMSSDLLVRDDVPLVERLRALAVRVGEVPRLCRQARAALETTPPGGFGAAKVSTAAHQARAAGVFLGQGLASAADGLPEGPERDDLRRRLGAVGREAGAELDSLADFLDGLAATASGSPRLGDFYAESFRLGTGASEPVAEILADAERRLAEGLANTAEFCRSIWLSQGIDRSSGLAEAPAEDVETVRACFARIALDHAGDLDEFVEEYGRLAREAQDFAVQHGVVELPESFRLVVDRSPAYFVGQAVGGVYPPGPFAPEGTVLLFVPSYSDDTPEEVVAGFYRDFNDHFNTMITPHETVPGHAAQMALAAQRAKSTGNVARELFADGVYAEGWGTFSELLMLDLGWGTPLDRVAHLKKRLENIARLIVDIRVHTTDVDQDEILRFVQNEALQDEQFATNMWRRALLSTPQLATYDLGSRRIYQVYEAERSRLGSRFDAGDFVRAMTRFGSVSVEEYVRNFPALLDSPAGTAPPQPDLNARSPQHRPGSPSGAAPLPGSNHGL